jgi:RNA ligase
MTPVAEWTEPMKDCRGLILDHEGYIVGRPFRKFWNMSQMLDQVPVGEPFTVWEKLDGSLGIVCSYAGDRVVATRGSFESEQAVWFKRWLDSKHPNFMPSGETWLLEILFPENRIVVDYGDRKEGVLLSVMSPDGQEMTEYFDLSTRFTKARRFDGIADFAIINFDPQFAGEEGFVVKWANGFRAKVKADEYCRLHRLITSCSTRTIWELLRSGSGIQELVDRVPAEFKQWVEKTAGYLNLAHATIDAACGAAFLEMVWADRKDYASQVVGKPYANVMFALLDGKPTEDMIWKMIEPKWATPFRKESEDV